MLYSLKALKKMTDDEDEREMRRACNKSYIFMAQSGFITKSHVVDYLGLKLPAVQSASICLTVSHSVSLN